MDMTLWNPPALHFDFIDQSTAWVDDVDQTHLQHSFDPPNMPASSSNTMVTKKGPSKEEWDHHRQTITRLYSEEDKTLPQVMEHMNKVGFFATKMYNNRIKMWGIDNKNVKRSEALAMLAVHLHCKTKGTVPTFIIRGRVISLDTLFRYANRARISTRDYIKLDLATIKRTVPQLSWRTAPSDITHPRPPDELYRCESLFKALRDYLNGAFENKLCSAGGLGGISWISSNYDALGLVIRNLMRALKDFANGRTAEAGVALRIAFLKSEEFVHDSDPENWLNLLETLSRVSRQRPDVSEMMRKHMLSLMDAQQDKSYPHKRLVQGLLDQRCQEVEMLLTTCQSLILQTYRMSLSEIEYISLKTWFRVDISAQELICVENEILRLLEGLKACPTLDNIFSVYLLPITALSTMLARSGKSRKVSEVTSKILDTIASYDDCDGKVVVLCGLAYSHIKLEDWTIVKTCIQYLEGMFPQAPYTSEARDWSPEIYSFYKRLDWVSNESSTADGDQQWRSKMRMIEQRWEDELVATVGILSLDEITV